MIKVEEKKFEENFVDELESYFGVSVIVKEVLVLLLEEDKKLEGEEKKGDDKGKGIEEGQGGVKDV